MIRKRTLFVLFAATIALILSGAPSAVGKEVLHVYNWSDYMDEGPGGPVSVFEKQTDIDVTYDVFDSNEVLEAKLLAGKSGYDVVFPSTNFIGRQITAGVFQKLDRAKLKNYKHLDTGILKVLESVDPGNEYSIPYMWGTTGLGYNVKKVQAAFGGNAPVDSWDLIFKPENAAKLKDCGLVMLDDPSEILSLTLHYLGKDPNSMNKMDYTDAALPLLKSIRPYIKYFHSSQYINDLANGDICAVIGWSGDILQARDRADEAGAGVQVAYSIPKEGAGTWFDMIAIPADADNVDNAHKFLDFLMEPEVIAGITNYVSYPNGNADAFPFIDKEIREDKAIYPSAETMKGLFTMKNMPPKTSRVRTRVWTQLKTGQ
ncbi:Putrescine ABC transporter putrescine-binding protein PotF (TC 3.A.1.11.2) [Olavius algarvensis Delta 1 endosymbiont]|nr:Putrescine ABC transporter putrescine-binding protein PotF (TC 3.A.1.11.2) [Olavius algarvensis Delta 1 endosymbiont]